MLKEINEQPDAVAQDDRRPHPRPAGRARRARPRRRRDPQPASHGRPRLRHRLPRRARRSVPDRGVGARSRASSTSRASGATAIPSCRRDTLVVAISQSGETADTLAAMRLARETRGAHARDHERDRHADHARGRRRALHPRGPRDRRRGDQDVHVAGHGCSRCSPCGSPRRAGRCEHTPEQLLAEHRRAIPTRSADFLTTRRHHPIDEVAAAHYAEAVLPLPRPPRRPAGVPRGRTQAQGDLATSRPRPTRPAR